MLIPIYIYMPGIQIVHNKLHCVNINLYAFTSEVQPLHLFLYVLYLSSMVILLGVLLGFILQYVNYSYI